MVVCGLCIVVWSCVARVMLCGRVWLVYCCVVVCGSCNVMWSCVACVLLCGRV